MTPYETLDVWIDAHFDEEVRFLQQLVRVATDTPPAPNDGRDVELLHPLDTRRRILADAELEKLVDTARNVRDQAAELDRMAAAADDAIKLRMLDAGAIVDQDGRITAQWIAPTRKTIDWESVVAELVPHVARSTYHAALAKHSKPKKRYFRIGATKR